MKIHYGKFQIAMANKCWNCNELMKKADIGLNTYCNIKKGKDLQTKTVGKIAKALGVDVLDLVDLSELE